MSNLHPCANKCSEYKAEQCKSCLIQETKVQGVYVMGKADYMGDDAHIDKKKQCEPLQTEVTRLNSTVERLKAENKMLHEAAATHLKNQMHFKKLYDALVEQLYPYAIDLEEPVDEDVNTPKEYMDGYNRARECVHYNLLEMMESDVEYIRAQCGMLGGGGEA